MALATASASMETSTLVESRVQRSYQEVQVTERQTVKKKKSRRHHKEEGSISVSKSSEKLHKKLSSDVEEPKCSKCSRPVYAMERVKAEKRVWHKECFRCVQCSKQLTVETYQSDHTTLYCKPHFKQLFEPKPVDEEDEVDATPKKHQMIICENNPVELPPDVVRASDKPELGLEELTQLDVKARFEMFENAGKQGAAPRPASPPPAREPGRALLAKLAKFKAKGMDIGVSDDYLNGVPVEASSSEAEDDDDDEDSVLRKSYRHSGAREQPPSFCNMSEIMSRFEGGADSAAERHRHRKQEIQNIRSRLFMGKQAKIKEMYEQSVLQSEQGVTSADKIARDLDYDLEKARAIKQRFEAGFNDENQPPRTREVVDTSIFNEGISKKSRSIFLELDANAKSLAPASPPHDAPRRKEIPFIPKDLVRSEDKQEDVKIQTADISDRFKFFETYRPETTRKEFRMTPPRQTQRAKSPSPELYHEPGVARSAAPARDGAQLAADRHTASKMIHVFRQMEEQRNHQDDQGPKPLKCFTPPPPGERTHTGDTSSSGEYSEDSEDEQECYREYDEDLKQAQQLARTKSFRDRFENWSEAGPQRAPSAVVLQREAQDDEMDSQLETAKSLRQKFESMNVTTSSVSKSGAAKVNRFV